MTQDEAAKIVNNALAKSGQERESGVRADPGKNLTDWQYFGVLDEDFYTPITGGTKKK